jgi:aspartyl/glutamyl-tRNA(Asn/Gln) amidotransferase C subunit
MVEQALIKKLSVLSRVHLQDHEIRALGEDLEQILHFVAQIESVFGDNNPREELVTNVMRDDCGAHTPGQYTNDIMSEVPKKQSNFVKVKKIL